MKSKQGHLKVLDKFFSSHSIPDALLAQKNEIYAAGYLDGACAEVAIGDDAAAIEDLKRAWELAPQMFAGRGEPAWDIIVGSCQNLIYHQAPADALRRVATVLPPEARQMRQSLRWVMGRLYLSQYFEAFRQRKWKQVRGSFWRWLPYIPSALLNRGVLSIWLRSWLSPLIARCLEKRMTS
jgi:hypothetical protein